VPLENPPLDAPRKALDLVDIRNSLTSLMWRDVGVRRSADGMTQAVEMIDRWCRYVLVRQFNEPHGWELQNMLTVARDHREVGAWLARNPAASTCGPISAKSTTKTGIGI
jgi:hypothetical protein